MRRVVLTAALAGVVAVLAGCGDDDQTPAATAAAAVDFPITIKNCGRRVTIDKPPQRIVSGGTTVAYLLAAAGGVDRIVARYSEFGAKLSGAAAAANDKPVLAAEHDISTEELINTGAELNFSRSGSASPKQIDKLKKAGIPTIFPSGLCPTHVPRRIDFETVYADINQVGRLLGTTADAETAVAALRKRVAGLKPPAKAAAGGTAIQVQIYDGVIYVFGSASMEQTQIEALGLKNAAGDVAKEGYELSRERLIDRDPDVIILQDGFDDGHGLKGAAKARREFLALPGASKLKAVRDKTIVTINYVETGPDPLAIDGIEHIAAQLHG